MQSWISSLNNLIDLGAQGLIGTKAGFSTPVDAQLRQMLATATTALVSVKEATAKRKEAVRRKQNAKGAAKSETPAPTVVQLERAAKASNGDELGDTSCVQHSEAGDGEYDAPVVSVAEDAGGAASPDVQRSSYSTTSTTRASSRTSSGPCSPSGPPSSSRTTSHTSSS